MTLPETERLYLDDPYISSFFAEIIATQPAENAGRFVAVLDRSYFFPESGGQQADRGQICSLPVMDVQERPGGVIFHSVAGTSGDAARLKNAEVECLIDWETRFDHMQQHTGQHVLSRAFIETAGLETVSFHMGEQTCTIDLEGGKFDERAVTDAEELANSIVTDNRPVVVRTVPAAKLDSFDLRKSVPDGVSEARLVEVEGFDLIPCCGTHVRRTGELGVIKVLKGENVKGTRRVYFKVGKRALEDYKVKHGILHRVTNRLTTSAEGVEAKIEKLLGQKQESEKNLKRVTKQLASYHKNALLQSAVDFGGVRFVVGHLPDSGADYLRMLTAGFKAEKNTVVVLGGGDGSVVCWASGGVVADFESAALAEAEAVGGSGGGKGPFVQLRLPARVNIEDFLRKVENNVKASL